MRFYVPIREGSVWLITSETNYKQSPSNSGNKIRFPINLGTTTILNKLRNVRMVFYNVYRSTVFPLRASWSFDRKTNTSLETHELWTVAMVYLLKWLMVSTSSQLRLFGYAVQTGYMHPMQSWDKSSNSLIRIILRFLTMSKNYVATMTITAHYLKYC